MLPYFLRKQAWSLPADTTAHYLVAFFTEAHFICASCGLVCCNLGITTHTHMHPHEQVKFR